LFPQLDHSHIPLIPRRAASLSSRFDKCQPLGRGFRVGHCLLPQCCPRVDLHLLDIVFHGHGKIAHQMISIQNLHRRRRTLSTAVGIQCGPISCDDPDFRMTTQPLTETVGGAHREQINDAPLLQIHQ
jgi:hypothetical protein